MPGNEDCGRVIVIVGAGAAGATIGEAVCRSDTQGLPVLMVDSDPQVWLHNLRKTATLGNGDIGRGPKVLRVVGHLRRIRPQRRIAGVPRSIEQIAAGVFRLAGAAGQTLVIDAVDRLDAQLHIAQLASAAGVTRLLSARLEGGDSAAASLRVFAPGSGGPCPICAWGQREWAVLNRQNRPCTTAAELPHPSGFAGPLHLAAEALTAVEHWIQEPARLTPGDEIRIVPEAQRYLRLHTAGNEQCPLAPHAPWPRLDLEGRVGSFTVGDFLAAADRLLGREWRWLLPHPVSVVRCAACGRIAGLQRRDIDPFPAACPLCAAPIPATGPGLLVRELAARDLEPAAQQTLARLWPAGDIIKVSVAGSQPVALGLPAGGLFEWYSGELYSSQEGDRRVAMEY